MSFIREHKIFSACMILILLGAIWFRGRLKGPYPDYELDLMAPEKAAMATAPEGLQVGVGMEEISPDFAQYDDWVDVNENSKYDKGTDTFTDRNGNGNFDAVWMAGFNSNRPAKGVNDTPWTRAIALRNNGVTLVLVTIDSVGIFQNDFIAVRESVSKDLGINHILFSSSHTHESADTMKIWSGPTPIFGYDERYMDMVRDKTRAAVERAVLSMRPAEMDCTTVEIAPEGFVDDSRKPVVMDNTMYLMRFTKKGSDDTIATFVNWGNHPEALGGKNGMITSDFPHWLREGVEKGVPAPNGVEGFGGMCLFFQGQVGGLMTQLHTTVPHRDGQQSFSEASFEKAQALGENLAIVACNALRSDRVWKNENPRLAVSARTIRVPVTGAYKYAMMFGLIHEGYKIFQGARTELNVIRIGGVLLLSVPGEIYPEIVEGGVEALPGRDYEIEPVEVPPLRDEMERKARMALVIGLANDQIGYMVPKTQWDVKAPYIYDGEAQYGEENSGGPDVAPTIHRESLKLLEEMNGAFPEPEPGDGPAQPSSR